MYYLFIVFVHKPVTRLKTPYQTFPSPQRISLLFLLFFTSTGNRSPHFYPHKLVLPVVDCHVYKITHTNRTTLLFLTFYFSQHNVFKIHPHYYECQQFILSILLISSPLIEISNLFAHPPVDEKIVSYSIGIFAFWSVVKNVKINILVYISCLKIIFLPPV